MSPGVLRQIRENGTLVKILVLTYYALLIVIEITSSLYTYESDMLRKFIVDMKV